MKLSEAYRVLGLTREATSDEVKAAFRRLAVTAHPDRGGSAVAFIRLRAAYEIVSAHLESPVTDDEFPIPEDLRQVIAQIVADFDDQREWAQARTVLYLQAFQRHLSEYIATATRAELRQLGDQFRGRWNATLNALFAECNIRSDNVVQRYESWFSRDTRAVFDEMYRRELRGFLWRARFWEVFAVAGALAAGLTVVVGWTWPWRLAMSAGMMGAALGVSFLAYRWLVGRSRRRRERVEPLSVVPFRAAEGAELPTTALLRRGRRTTTALGLTGLLAGGAAAGGLMVPLIGAAAGTALGGALDRLLRPTEEMRESMQADLERFVATAQPQLLSYVEQAHTRLLTEVRSKIEKSYQERVRGAVKLLKAGDSHR